MKVKEIVEKHLRDNGFDGLVHTWAECGCGVDDLFPCCGGEGVAECEPAYKHPGTEGGDYDVIYSITKHQVPCEVIGCADCPDEED